MFFNDMLRLSHRLRPIKSSLDRPSTFDNRIIHIWVILDEIIGIDGFDHSLFNRLNALTIKLKYTL